MFVYICVYKSNVSHDKKICCSSCYLGAFRCYPPIYPSSLPQSKCCLNRTDHSVLVYLRYCTYWYMDSFFPFINVTFVSFSLHLCQVR
jgi:hypothetical protein